MASVVPLHYGTTEVSYRSSSVCCLLERLVFLWLQGRSAHCQKHAPQLVKNQTTTRPSRRPVQTPCTPLSSGTNRNNTSQTSAMPFKPLSHQTSNLCTSDLCMSDLCMSDPCTSDPCLSDPCTSDPCLSDCACQTVNGNYTCVPHVDDLYLIFQIHICYVYLYCVCKAFCL